MDLIYSIFSIMSISMIQSQQIPCHLPGYDKIILNERLVGKMCDPKRPGQWKKLPSGNKLSATQCTHMLNGKVYTVFQKKSVGRNYVQWQFCSNGKQLDRKFCQYKNVCHMEETILAKMKSADARTAGQGCYELLGKLQNNYRETFKQMFLSSSESCNFSKMISSPASVSPPKVNQQRKEYPQVKLQINPSKPEKSLSIDGCRHGIYNKVFYVDNEPKYCVINDWSKNKDKCLSMQLLNNAMKYNLSEETFEFIDNGDFTAEYKRYIFKHRYTIYDDGDTYPSSEMLRETLNKPFNRKENMTDGFFWGDKYTLFVRKTAELLSPSMVDVQQMQIFNQIGVPDWLKAPVMHPPKLLCDIYLTLFPVSNAKLSKIVPIEDCPSSSNHVEQNIDCKSSAEYPNSKSIRFPNVFGLVNYDKNKNPIGCFVPYNHADFSGLRCISFEEAEKLLNHKNNEDQDINPGHGVLYIDDKPRPETAVKHYRRNYMAGVLRMYEAGHKPHEYQEPESYYWSNLRRTNTVQDILFAISAALGYETDEKRVFTINNQWNEPKSVKISLSVNGFCRAILEMIPFSRQQLEKAEQQSC